MKNLIDKIKEIFEKWDKLFRITLKNGTFFEIQNSIPKGEKTIIINESYFYYENKQELILIDMNEIVSVILA